MICIHSSEITLFKYSLPKELLLVWVFLFTLPGGHVTSAAFSCSIFSPLGPGRQLDLLPPKDSRDLFSPNWFIHTHVGVTWFFSFLPPLPHYRPSCLCLCRQSGPAQGQAVWGSRCSLLVAAPPEACLTETSWSALPPVAQAAASARGPAVGWKS